MDFFEELFDDLRRSVFSASREKFAQPLRSEELLVDVVRFDQSVRVEKKKIVDVQEDRLGRYCVELLRAQRDAVRGQFLQFSFAVQNGWGVSLAAIGEFSCFGVVDASPQGDEHPGVLRVDPKKIVRPKDDFR